MGSRSGSTTVGRAPGGNPILGQNRTLDQAASLPLVVVATPSPPPLLPRKPAPAPQSMVAPPKVGAAATPEDTGIITDEGSELDEINL